MTDTKETETTGASAFARGFRSALNKCVWPGLIIVICLIYLSGVLSIGFLVKEKSYPATYYRLVLHKGGCIALGVAGIQTSFIPSAEDNACSSIIDYNPADPIRQDAIITFLRNGKHQSMRLSPHEIIAAERMN